MLTAYPHSVDTNLALAKSSVRLGLLFLPSALALIRSAFFVPTLWWAVLGASARCFSVGGSPTCTARHPMLGLIAGGFSTIPRAHAMNALSIHTQQIRQRDGLYSLNDLHKAAGKADKHKPANFMRLAQTRELIIEIERCSDMSSSSDARSSGCSDVSTCATKVITGIGTYVCEELVYAYAIWINPAFYLQVIRSFASKHTEPTQISPSALPEGTIAVNADALHSLIRMAQLHDTRFTQLSQAMHQLQRAWNQYHDIGIDINYYTHNVTRTLTDEQKLEAISKELTKIIQKQKVQP